MSRDDHSQKNFRSLSEELLDARECMGCMHEGTLITDLQGAILESAPSAERILETPSVGLKGRRIQDFCAASAVYDDMRRQAIHDGRVLNRSLLFFAGAGKRKLVTISLQLAGTETEKRLVHVFQDCA